jgi:hypothetical protein
LIYIYEPCDVLGSMDRYVTRLPLTPQVPKVTSRAACASP